MNHVDGVPAVVATARRFLEADPSTNIIIAAPAFDDGGPFSTLFSDLPAERISLVFAADDSPLRRLVIATEALNEEDHIVRVDGLHFAVLTDAVLEMLAAASAEKWDCAKFPDDFPPQLGADIYKIGALRRLLATAPDGAFQVHPKYAMFADPEHFTCRHFPAPDVSDDYLRQARAQAETVYFIPRMDVTDKALEVGNQLTWHYQEALKYLPGSGRVLDIACGDGYGSRLMAENGYEVVGGDLDPEIVVTAQGRSKGMKNAPDFRVLDVTKLALEDASFDAVVSMETVEHVDDQAYLAEICRVLKPGGTFILSTPQNSLGHIPVNAEHVREYSLKQIQELCQTRFDVVQTIGIKQGRVVIPDSPLGTNTLLVCKKK
ncbi:class I SAM-dependent methyltransferase [Kordiimonas marina]|uniref:class I SAM-dependent methyltransferase n=1 Tax=Kordiimonas marina TaxID=2872312 RepID=UPI001FF1829F|nr:methyltransferase domain-containing protein [Kordiimonas marina]MCJ9430320.1 methyltransferase domain-containing protein [Kordiimonas marina]